MSNVIALRSPGGLPALPAEVQRRFDLAADAPDDLEPVYLPDAARCAPEVRRALTTPGSEAAIESFVMLLVRVLKPGALTPAGLVEGLVFACDDLPSQCWTSKVAKEIVRGEEFLPSVSVVRSYLLAVARPLWRGLNHLERCAKMKPPEAPRPVATPEEIAAVEAITAETVAALASARGDQRQRSAGRAIAADKLEDDDASFVVSTTYRDAQLAAFGDTGDVDLLAKLRAKYAREPKP
jgi:hypothetical protein